MEVYSNNCNIRTCGKIFTREISGKEYDLKEFYFKSIEHYSGIKGEYTVSLFIKNINAQIANKIFKVYIN